MVNWALFDATFAPVTNEQCGREGACWRYIIEKLDLFIYGFYPPEAYWRPQWGTDISVDLCLDCQVAKAT